MFSLQMLPHFATKKKHLWIKSWVIVLHSHTHWYTTQREELAELFCLIADLPQWHILYSGTYSGTYSVYLWSYCQSHDFQLVNISVNSTLASMYSSSCRRFSKVGVSCIIWACLVTMVSLSSLSNSCTASSNISSTKRSVILSFVFWKSLQKNSKIWTTRYNIQSLTYMQMLCDNGCFWL